MLCDLYVGFKRETLVHSTIDLVDGGLSGVGKINCLECGGDGDWTKFFPENGPQACVDCKGTGKVWVSV